MPATDLSRRSVLTAGAGGLLAAALPGLGGADAAAAEPEGRPNFLVFFTEDNNPYNGAYGDPVAITPNIDRLGAEGVRFEVAYCPAPVCAPSRFGYITGLSPETAGPAHHMRAIAKMPSYVRGFPEFLRGAGYYTTNNAKTDYNANIDIAATWNANGGQAHWRNRPAGAPFYAQFTTMVNHESSLFNVVDGAVRPEDVEVPDFLPDTLEIRRGIAHSYNRQTAADAVLGQRLAELEADGVADDTIVIYLGDNGGALPWSKRFANNNGLHIPLIVKVPPRWQHLVSKEPGQRWTYPVNGIDLPPTVLSLAGLPIPDYMQGQVILERHPKRQYHAFGQRSRMDERYDLQRTVRNERFVYIRNYLPHRPYGQMMGYMWQQRAYQLWQQAHLEGTLTPEQDRFWDEKPWEELYDLEADPHQVNNLADVPRYKSTRNKLRQALEEHLVEVNDNGFIPESHPAEGYDESRAPGAYPLDYVMEVAELAARRDPANLDRLLLDLEHDNDIVRYWAATGLLTLGADAETASKTLAEKLASEGSVYVRIPLAEALARMGHTYHSVEFLAQTVDTHENPRVRLQALNALTYVGVAALPYKPVVDRAASSGDEYIRNAGRFLKFVLEGTWTPTTPIFGGL
jgi:arylsulfatase A-like enzyme